MLSFLKGLVSFVLAIVITVAGYYVGIMLAVLGGILLTVLTILGIICAVAAGIYSWWTETTNDDKNDPPNNMPLK